MKAVIFYEHGGPDVLRYEDVPEPAIGSDEVLVRVRACALNHLDLWVRKGIPGVTLPHIVGSDVAGDVAVVGEMVEGVRVGDRVVIAPGISCWRCEYCLGGDDNICLRYKILGSGTDGGYAEYVRVPGRNVIPIPERLSYEETAAVPLVFLTAWHMLMTRARLTPGESVLILAAGSGVGSAAVQIARLAGTRVIAAAGSEEKLEKAKQLGADEVINYEREDLAEALRRLTGKRGVDVVFEHVGAATFGKSIASLTRGGRLVTCGATTGAETAIDLRLLFVKQLSVLGSMMGTRRELDRVLQLVGERKLRPVIDRIIPLTEARKAQELLENRQQFGKIVLVPTL